MTVAKSHGVDLESHSLVTALQTKELAEKLCPKMCFFGDSNQEARYHQLFIGCCYLVGLFHDIGKSIPTFQDYITGDHNVEIQGHMVFHNEAGAAFLMAQSNKVIEALSTAVFGVDGYCMTQDDWIFLVCYAVYYHHGISRNRVGRGKKYAPMSPIDIISAKYTDLRTGQERNVFDVPVIETAFNRICAKAFGDGVVTADTDMNIFYGARPAAFPQFMRYNTGHEDNDRFIGAFQMNVLSVLLCVDQNHTGANTVPDSEYNDHQLPDLPEGYDLARWDAQNEYIEKMMHSDRSNIFFVAPAGAGKTSTALRYLSRCNCTFTRFWIVPRNIIAVNVFSSLVNEIRRLKLGMSVEYRYGGIRYSDIGVAMDDDAPLPDIVVTNIDAFIGSITASYQYPMQYAMLHDPVVFDEYHEFISDSPMYAMTTFMRDAREMNGVKSIFLSATPECECDSFRDTILPEPYRHMKAQHSKPYKISCLGDIPSKGKAASKDKKKTVTLMSDKIEPGSIMVAGRISDAQRVEADLYLHSHFTEEDRVAIEAAMMAEFGKANKGVEHKLSLSCAMMVKASLDISCRKIYVVATTFADFMQIIGRCNRWGEYDDAEIVIIFCNPKHNNLWSITTDTLYYAMVNIMKAKMIGQTLTLDEMYEIYDEYCQKFRSCIKNMHEQFMHTGVNDAIDYQLYPVRITGNDKPDPTVKYGRPNWRSVDGTRFAVARYEDGTWLDAPIAIAKGDIDGYGVKNGVRSNGKAESSLHHLHNALKSIKDIFPVWGERIKKRRGRPVNMPDDYEIRDRATCSSTPYPILPAVYTKLKGLQYK